MKVSVAAFKTEYNTIALLDDELNGVPSGWVQVTEFVDVDLPDVPDAIERQVEQINREIEKEKGKHYAEIKRLEQKKQELLAIGVNHES